MCSLKSFCTVRNFAVCYDRLKWIVDFDKFTNENSRKLPDRDFCTRCATKIVLLRGGLRGWKFIRLAEILTFYFQLFSPATVYYGIYFNREVPLASNAKNFLRKIILEICAHAPSLCLEFCSFCDSRFLPFG